MSSAEELTQSQYIGVRNYLAEIISRTSWEKGQVEILLSRGYIDIEEVMKYE